MVAARPLHSQSRRARHATPRHGVAAFQFRAVPTPVSRGRAAFQGKWRGERAGVVRAGDLCIPNCQLRMGFRRGTSARAGVAGACATRLAGLRHGLRRGAGGTIVYGACRWISLAAPPRHRCSAAPKAASSSLIAAPFRHLHSAIAPTPQQAMGPQGRGPGCSLGGRCGGRYTYTCSKPEKS